MTVTELPHETVQRLLKVIVTEVQALGLLGQLHDDLPWTNSEQALALYQQAGYTIPPTVQEVAPRDWSISIARMRDRNTTFLMATPARMDAELADMPFRGEATIQKAAAA